MLLQEALGEDTSLSLQAYSGHWHSLACGHMTTIFHLHDQFSLVAQCLTLCDPMDCSTPGLPVHHQLPEFSQTLVHWVGDAIQPSHPLLPPSSPALNLLSIRVFSNESCQREGGKCGNSDRLFSWAPKSLQTVTAAMK